MVAMLSLKHVGGIEVVASVVCAVCVYVGSVNKTHSHCTEQKPLR
jgi:hypothetical protein